MALDRQTLVNKLRASGAFTESEIESEADTMMKDDRAAERRDTLNSTKVAAEPVAATQPAPAALAAPAASVAPPAPAAVSVPTVPAGTTAADLVTGKVTPSGMGTPPEQRVGQVGQNVVDAGGNLVQNAVDYFSTFPNYHPNITGAALAVPIAYAAHKAAQATGLYDTLVSKMATNNASAQPQPFVGGSGPRNTPPAITPAAPAAPAVTPAATPIQDWDIHNDPAWSIATSAPATPAATTEAPPAAPVNTKLQELQARAAAGLPTTPAASVAPETMPAKTPWAPPTAEVINKPSMLSSGTTIGTAPARPVTPTPPAALASTTTPTTEPVPPTGYNKRVTEAMAGVPKSVQDQYAKEGKTVLKGYGAGDRNLTNTYGPEAYATIIDHFNNGKPIGSYENYLEVQKKINQGIPSSLAPEFAAKLPGSEAEAGNFATKFGDTGAYTKEGKVVTSPNAIKKAVAGGGALFLATTMPAKAGALTTTAALTALPALGEAAYNKYKGNEAAVTASLQDAKNALKSLATMPYDVSKAALQGNLGPFKDLMMSMNPGSLLFNEMDKHDEAILKNMIQKEKVGAGRGLQGVAPPTR